MPLLGMSKSPFIMLQISYKRYGVKPIDWVLESILYLKMLNQIVDDHYYVNQITGIPTIDIIEYDPATESNFNKHWHTHRDDMDNIDKSTLNAVGQTLLEVIYTE